MKLRTLGGVAVDGAKYGREKPLLLLVYLALEGPQARRHLAALFWPEAESGQQLNNLNQHLIRLRPLGEVVQDSGQLVSAQVECDALEFRQQLRLNHVEEALSGYAGAFLQGLKTPLGQELEEWVYGTREALAAEARAGLLRVAEDCHARAELAEAAARAERAYGLPGASPPEPEELPRFFRLLSAAQHPLAEVIRRDARDLGMTLTPHHAPTALKLVGRQPECAALHALKPGQTGWISGHPGMGKSALLGALSSQGWRVLPGRPGLPLSTLEPLASRPLTGSAEALTLLADPRLRLAVDGWEDTDEATRALLTLAARQRPGAVVVVTARHPPTLPCDLHLTLGPLTEAELQDHPGAFAQTAGHPLMLRAFLRGTPATRSLDDHLNLLGPGPRALLLALAAQDSPHLNATRAALNLTAPDFARTLDQLVREGLIGPDGVLRTPTPARDLLAAQGAETPLLHLHLARASPASTAWPHWKAARDLWESRDEAAAAQAAHHYADQEMKRGYPARAAATLELAPQTDEVKLLRGWALLECTHAQSILDMYCLENRSARPVKALCAQALLMLARNDEAELLARTISDGMDIHSAIAKSILGHCARRRGDEKLALRIFKSALKMFELHGDEDRKIEVATHILFMDATSQTFDIDNLFDSARGNPRLLGIIHNNYSRRLSLDGNRSQALHHSRKAFEYFVQCGSRLPAAVASNNIGVELHISGDVKGAVEMYKLSIEMTKSTGDMRQLALSTCNLSEISQNDEEISISIQILIESGNDYLAQAIQEHMLSHGGQVA